MVMGKSVSCFMANKAKTASNILGLGMTANEFICVTLLSRILGEKLRVLPIVKQLHMHAGIRTKIRRS